MLTHNEINVCLSGINMNRYTFIVHAFAYTTLIPITTTFQICTGLFVKSFHIIGIAPFIRSSTASQTERYTSQLYITPLFIEKLTCTFVHDITDSHIAGIEFRTLCTFSDDIQVILDSRITRINVEFSFSTK